MAENQSGKSEMTDTNISELSSFLNYMRIMAKDAGAESVESYMNMLANKANKHEASLNESVRLFDDKSSKSPKVGQQHGEEEPVRKMKQAPQRKSSIPLQDEEDDGYMSPEEISIVNSIIADQEFMASVGDSASQSGKKGYSGNKGKNDPDVVMKSYGGRKERKINVVMEANITKGAPPLVAGFDSDDEEDERSSSFKEEDEFDWKNVMTGATLPVTKVKKGKLGY